jgi:hypothetical protein
MTSENVMSIRDFVYLGVERVKSMLAQLDRGLLNDYTESSGASRSLEGKAGVSIPALMDVGGASHYVSTDQTTETRTLHDFIYNETENRLLELGGIRRLPDDFTSEGLMTEDVRASLSPVEYILAKGRVEISDFRYMMSLLSNFNELAKAINEVSHHDRIRAATGKDKDIANIELQKVIAGSKLDDKYLRNLMRIFEHFVKDRLVIKAIPFQDDPNIRIAGPLQRALLRENLDDIRFKFGSSPLDDWTVFGQIAAVPPKNDSRANRQLAFSNELDRALHELFGSLRGIEDQFRVTYPEIAITPIAVYRD